MKQRLQGFFNGQNSALAGVMTASVGMAIASILEAAMKIDDLWVWGFSVGFGGGMMFYTIICHFVQPKEEV